VCSALSSGPVPHDSNRRSRDDVVHARVEDHSDPSRARTSATSRCMMYRVKISRSATLSSANSSSVTTGRSIAGKVSTAPRTGRSSIARSGPSAAGSARGSRRVPHVFADLLGDFHRAGRPFGGIVKARARVGWATMAASVVSIVAAVLGGGHAVGLLHSADSSFVVEHS